MFISILFSMTKIVYSISVLWNTYVYTSYIIFKMSKNFKKLEKHTFNAEESLNIIFSDEYTLGTSSSDESSSEFSYLDYSSDTNPELPSPKWK